MKRFLIANLVFGITLAGCSPREEVIPRDVLAERQSSSSVIAVAAASSSSSASSEKIANEKLQNLKNLFRENEHNYFAILSTGKDKSAANNSARDFGAWVLPTDFTSALSPNLYAVVLGPFSEETVAKNAMNTWPVKNPAAYVKDAGRLKVPVEFEKYASALPVRALVAIAGRVQSSLSNVEIQADWREMGGSFCMPIDSAFHITTTQNGKPIADMMSPNEIAQLKEFSGEENPSADSLQRPISFWIVERTGEVVGPHFCWD
ncbi:MAG TPA: hypothetical protein VJB82_00365 [Candidatus Peribacterales bacterium]|nr:hypothetical protein [Candidatus Peribacterales bacterium]